MIPLTPSLSDIIPIPTSSCLSRNVPIIQFTLFTLRYPNPPVSTAYLVTISHHTLPACFCRRRERSLSRTRPCLGLVRVSGWAKARSSTSSKPEYKALRAAPCVPLSASQLRARTSRRPGHDAHPRQTQLICSVRASPDARSGIPRGHAPNWLRLVGVLVA